jgi:ATP synthase protein I
MAGKQEKNWWVLMGRYSHIGFVLPASLFVGWLIGAALDRWLGTSWIYLLGLMLGIVAGFVELVRTLLRAEREESDGGGPS